MGFTASGHVKEPIMRPIPPIDYEQQRGAPLDDAAMEQHIRSLAVSLNTDGEAAVRFRPAAALKAPLHEAVRLAREAESLPAALEWLMENGRLAEAFMLSLRKDSSPRLPAAGGTARILHIARAIVRHSDALITLPRLTACLTAFDEVRALTMDELWAVPDALAAVLCDEYLAVSRRSLSALKERRAAVRWLEEGMKSDSSLSRRSPAFFEYALRHMQAQEMHSGYQALTGWLAGHDRTADQIIRIEHERQAMDRLLLGNILTTLRMLSALDWSEQFGRISRAEIALMADPGSVYPHMDDPSRAQVRLRVARLAALSGMGEVTIARFALNAASEGEGIERQICWWLHTDAGTRELLRRLRVKAAPPPLVPDPRGRKYMTMTAALTLLLLAGCFALCGPAAALIALPVLWGAASSVINRLLTHFIRPAPLLRLELPRIPDEYRTLVVLPALISSEERAESLAAELEALGCLEKDENLSFLLLGDLPGHISPERAEDAAILSAAQEAIQNANLRAGREKYFFLHRPRVLQRCEGRYMGRERKRGALEDLNRLLLEGENAFAEQSAHALIGRFAFVITLDAGTRMLPGTAGRLIGALAHPVNRLHRDPDGRLRGYALLAPRMEPEPAVSQFAALYGGMGGTDSYPTAVSDVFQDFCGQGTFGGKGIYDVAAFDRALRGRLPDNLILSHDLIEGLIARAGFLSDVALYEGHPRTAKAYFMRLNRWTRGDWQLIPLLKRPLGLSALDRYRIIDNLRRSLEPISQLILLFWGYWTHALPIVLAGMLPFVLPLLLNPRWSKETGMRLILRISLLPHEVYSLLSAILRALWRMTVSRRNLLQWTTADEADRRGGPLSPFPGWACSALLLPALAAPAPWLLTDVLLAALWWTSATLASGLEEEWDRPAAFSSADCRTLHDLAQRTFLYFSRNTPDTGLPPDNVQLEPDNGAARRTSPTNIGLYLASCISARELGLIDAEELERRIRQTCLSLERMEKWHGQPYNWYHIDTLEPLRPRYVSSVDSGNLAACLLTAARSMALEGFEELSARLDALARQMDFTRLYDQKRRLFTIGMDVENNRLSASHYDLLASESRILSFTAILLGQVPPAHWTHLGRMLAPAGDSQALISWSGTLFEYLMPSLFLPLWQNTLIHQTNEAVIAAQISERPREALPWGVSESGYYAFDAALNYQYRAFGLPALALRGDAEEAVIAPYASLLALPFAPEETMENLHAMIDAGFLGEQGLYEAIDCNPERLPENKEYMIVKSHMAHHQGMILCSVCNALTGGALVRLFMDRPEAQAVRLLLQEKPAARIRLSAREERPSEEMRRSIAAHSSRAALLSSGLPDTHLLSGGGTEAVIAADGSGYVRRGGLLLNRREADPAMPPQGLFLHASDRTHGLRFSLTGTKCPEDGVSRQITFEPGSALIHTRTRALDVRTRAFVSPEDGAMINEITLINQSAQQITLDITSCFEPALAREADYEAHPAFQNLFIESSMEAPCALCLRRRTRSAGEESPAIIHAAAGVRPEELSFETDLMRLTGREGALSSPHAMPETLSGTLGSTINPCSALRASLSLAPHEKRSLCFSAGLTGDARAFALRHCSLEAGARALELAGTQARELIRYLGLSGSGYHLIQRAAALLICSRPRYLAAAPIPNKDLRREQLWALGISGDLPVMTACAADLTELEAVRELIRAHEFYRNMGLICDLALINEYGNDYSRPVHQRLESMIRASHLGALTGCPGGVHLLDGQQLTPEQRSALLAASGIVLTGKAPFAAQLRALLNRQTVPHPPESLLPSDPLPPAQCMAFNGFGGFTEDGYLITRTPAPAPWCNIMANRQLGCVVSERGGGFIWYRSSRSGRITPFENHPAHEGFGDYITITLPDGSVYAPSLYPGRTLHRPGASLFEGECSAFSWKEAQFVDPDMPLKCHRLTLIAKKDIRIDLRAHIAFLLNDVRRSSNLTVIGHEGGLLWARGAAGSAAFACFDRREAAAEEGVITLPVRLASGERLETDLIIGCAESREAIDSLIARFKESGGGDTRLREALSSWENKLNPLSLHTPDPLLNAMVNRWLPYQTISSRIMGRTGFYQPGGAYGFRDQLQDMLNLMPYDPAQTRSHLILCAAHQFESGDVQHWWHPERTGVRTRISDDMLFLPYVTAEYIEYTGDAAILDTVIPYLKDVPIPDDREDWYGEAEVSAECGTLHEHCLRAIRRGLHLGPHGLMLMGAGDWNDGMNRVGHKGVGESIWLTEFAIVVLEKYAPLCSPEIQQEFHEIAGRLREAVETHGWDGKWYRRAFMDDGTILGSSKTQGGCRIDSIAQSWAVFAGLSRERVKTALNEADRQLIDREHGLIRLLTPPFEGETPDPGYIRGYPPGVRENGGQYTHAACWLVIALSEMGWADRAWEAFRMLLPCFHSDTESKALLYRAEPYVIAGDVYSEPPHTGRGGWTWYTGAAGWMLHAAYFHLMGFRRQDDRITLRALLPDGWDRVSMTIREGASVYTLETRRDCGSPLIDGLPMPADGLRLIDDGRTHYAVFPPRNQ